MAELFGSLVERSQAPPSEGEVGLLRTLLADFIACALAARGQIPSDCLLPDGTAGRVAVLALRGSALDMDDINWKHGLHVGSVVLPTVIALGAEVGASGEAASRAAVAGYRTAAAVAAALGIDHRLRWHVTATAGALGSATAACVLLDHRPENHLRALSHAAATTGGVGQAAEERSGAAIMNRAAAAVTGLLAARVATTGTPAVRDVLTGDRGVFALMAPQGSAGEGHLAEGIADSSLRLFPVNGYSQSAVFAAAKLGRERSAGFDSMRIAISPAAARLTDGTAGPWWDTRRAVALAWRSGDPFAPLGVDADQIDLDQLVVIAEDLPAGSAIVEVSSGGRERSSGLTPPPGSLPLETATEDLLAQKWSRVLGQDVALVQRLADHVVDSGPSAGLVDSVVR